MDRENTDRRCAIFCIAMFMTPFPEGSFNTCVNTYFYVADVLLVRLAEACMYQFISMVLDVVLLHTRCPIARHCTIKDIEENNWSHGTNVRCRAARHRTVAVLKTTK